MELHSGKGSAPTLDGQLIAVKPIIVPTTGRGIDLQVKLTAPADGRDLPVIVFSHGNAWSMDGYQPLVDRWAAAGFVVVQPTHLDSRRNRIGFDDPRFAAIWRVRIADLHAVLDGLGDILDQLGGLTTRVDRDRVAVVGHSWGAQTAGALLGARVFDAEGKPGEDFSHPAVKAGALIAATGTGDTLTPFALKYLPFARPDFSTMSAPTLVIAGGKDQSAMSTRGPDWFTDAYHLGPAPKRLLTIAEGEHLFGGISGEAAKDTTDEDPARVVLVADAVSAYLHDVLGADARSWQALQNRISHSTGAFSTESK
ncbi:chlorophyllase [Kitasatospora sp. NPDC093558]|uniref:alpha/beta hydrolase family protein n=1 Tax=Kitasatospora sp. NPDC093558 TaxID=3155201 RepID=UPI00343B08AC